MNMKPCVWATFAIATGGLMACADTGPMQIFCAKQNRQVLLDHENSYECALHGGCGEAEITFLCLAADDPRYTAPHQLRKDDGVLTTEGH
jgi:hypothetical protein